ncbi:MAG: AAA family ATPase [Kiritimatiellae bacterium]|nr:AAA family ATPase [Kiritimatiellia bacterium]
MQSLITEPLGLYGWTKAEPVILAALLSEEPLLLVGPHGCAKSFVLERLAESLGMAFRLYNASLINYDDLVGVPLPDATRTRLEYLASPESIWEAEVVFIDEISRTRPELQNKLFPIIYDRRVQGRPLKKLIYRWAAMNPPPTNEELESEDALYLGSEPLDAALADRFPFIVTVPDWDTLSEDDRQHVLTDQFAGRHEFPVDIVALVAEAKERYAALVQEQSQKLAPFVAMVADKLRYARFDVSTRRATMLLRAVIAVHAAREVLARHTSGGEEPELYASALMAVLNALPDRARRPIDAARVTAACKAAWDICSLSDDPPLMRLMAISNPVTRLKCLVAERLSVPPDRVAAIVGEGIAGVKKNLRRGFALATYLALRDNADIPATTIELLAEEIRPAIEPSSGIVSVTMQKSKIGRTVALLSERAAREHGKDSELAQYHANLLNSRLPDGYSNIEQVEEASADFISLWKEFGL